MTSLRLVRHAAWAACWLSTAVLAQSTDGNARPAAPAVFKADPIQLLADAPRSGAVTMMPGEVYSGPGPMTVGYLGAKKQLVLPQGTWLLLAVGDRDSSHRVPVRLVSMVFAQFQVDRVSSLVRYTFNGRTGPGNQTWPDYTRCVQDTSTIGRKVERTQGNRSLCGFTGRWAQLPAVNDPAWDRALAALNDLGMPVPTGPVVQTFATVEDTRANLLNMQRVDFVDGKVSGSLRMPWLERYADLMIEGMDRRLDAAELEPVGTPSTKKLSLPE